MCAWTQQQAAAAMVHEEQGNPAPPHALEAGPEGAHPGGALAERVARLEELVEKQSEEIKALKKKAVEAEEGLPRGFSVYVVSTWVTGLLKPTVRRLIRGEVSRVFREATLPEEGKGAGWETGLSKAFVHFDEYLSRMEGATTVDPHLSALHNTIVEMTSCGAVHGGAAATYYSRKAKACTPKTFSLSLHTRYSEEAAEEQRKTNASRHQAITAKKGDSGRYNPYPIGTSGKGAGKGTKGKKGGKGVTKQDPDSDQNAQ